MKKANNKHNNKYDYSKTIYKNEETKLIIICPIHGEFTQQAGIHIMSFGCAKCVNTDDKHLIALEKFINKYIQVHGEKYNYSIVDYLNDSTKVLIICNKHGPFKQRPNAHMQGQ